MFVKNIFFAPGAESVCFDALPRGQAQQLSLARQTEKALIWNISVGVI